MTPHQRIKSKVLYIISGPNGAGKTTIASELIPPGTPFLNADEIKEDLDIDYGNLDLVAGRQFLQLLHSSIDHGLSVAFETTLSGKCHLGTISKAKRLGYQIVLCYLWLPSVELALLRVNQRVLGGGHDIPKDTIKRRYQRGLSNLMDLYFPCVDSWVVYNNSDVSERTVIARSSQVSGIEIIDPVLWKQFQTQCSNQ